MFYSKLKSLLAFALVLLLSCSFAVFAHAEENSDVVSSESAVSETQSETSDDSAVSEDESKDASSDASEAESETSAESSATGDVSEEDTSSGAPGWLGWAIAGGVIVVIALWIFISIKRKTPFGQKVVKFFKDYKSEIGKVVWLSKEDLVKKTVVVLVTIIIACIVIGFLDWAFTKLITLI